MDVKIPTDEDINELSNNLMHYNLYADIMNEEPRKMIMRSLKSIDETYAVRYKGELLFIYGIFSIKPDITKIFMLTSNNANNHKSVFLRTALHKHQELLKKYGSLYCVIDSRAVETIGWAKRVGYRDYGFYPINGIPQLAFRIGGKITCA